MFSLALLQQTEERACMSVQELLDNWQEGDAYRERVRRLCYVTPLSRYKIIDDPIQGQYGLLNDEVFVLRLTLKSNKNDYEDISVGSHAGPRLLGNKNIPACFNPIHLVSGKNGSKGMGATRTGQRLTQYNQEIYNVINLLFIVLHMDRTRKDGPVSDCLNKLSRFGDRDLSPYWAWKMNDLVGKYKSSAADINARLQKQHKNARTFDFPLIRQKLQQDNKLKSEDILF